MITNNAELYSAVKALSTTLHDAGYEQWSADLTDALAISTLPGEILGETRLQLQKLKLSKLPKVLGIKGQVDEALSYLNKILGRAG